ncbi:4-hydroxybenzoate 3-monooxygenase [Peterkaempfera bronchialis]|uniref:4-hydroxybenzoate 3-monooxygenase n=1 Tax=Peterkaempfera bronchialis TaxID=2126346 RepID=A0A345SUC1_9ACTN|nr:4-hydroxybenzoate 3-monooxygenase [Peterkaempfera bronchialis]AXI77326.1 4-hydroxybenzoate 3-monooxygenase [Peterkaempfera bronchialis]
MPGTVRERTTVVVVGAGPAGLTVAGLLLRLGIPCTVLERRPRSRVEQRQRAGIVEHRAVRMFEEWGLAERVVGGFPYDGVLEVRVDGESRLLDETGLAERLEARLCPQQVLVQRLIAACLEDGGDLRFEAAEVTLHGVTGEQPVVRYRDADGVAHEIACDLVAGCDGDHGVSRASIPDGVLTAYPFDHGIAWLTVLADAAPPRHPLLAVSRHGFAAHFARGPRASRFYLQVPLGDGPDDWPEDRVRQQLRARLGSDDGPPPGTVTEKEVFRLRSVVHEPMSHGRLHLVGDAAHIISPMGGKGMNLALYEAEVFARAVRDLVRDGDDAGLRSYSAVCLQRAWNYQEFSRWMTEMLHDAGDDTRTGPFRRRLARARLDRLSTSRASAGAFAELMAGLA